MLRTMLACLLISVTNLVAAEPPAVEQPGGPLPAGAAMRLGTVRFRPANASAWSPNGKLVATAGSYEVLLWDAQTGGQVGRWPIKVWSLEALVFSANGQLLAGSCQHSHELYLWEVSTGKQRFHVSKLDGGQCQYNPCPSFSPDGTKLLICTPQTCRTVDTTTGHELASFSLTDNPSDIFAGCYAFSHDGQRLAMGSRLDPEIRVWHVPQGKLLHVLEGHQKRGNGINVVAFSPDGTRLASGSTDNTARIWDLAKGKTVRKLGDFDGGFGIRWPYLRGHECQVVSVAFSPDGKWLATAGNDRWWSSGSGEQTIRIWDLENPLRWERIVPAPGVESLRYAPDGKTLSWRCNDESLNFLDPVSGKEILPQEAHRAAVNAVVYFPDGKTIATGSSDGTIRLWDTASGKTLRVLTGHAGAVNGLAIAPDGATLASASADNTGGLWDLTTGKRRFSLKGHNNDVLAVAFTPDGKTLLMGGLNFIVHHWDVATGKEIRQDQGKESAAGVTVSPDGKLYAAGGSNTVRLHDLATGKVLHRFEVEQQVTSVVFSPGGKTLAAGANLKLWLWNVDTGKEISNRFRGHFNQRGGLAFSPDGTKLASGSYRYGDINRYIHVWDLASGQELGQHVGHSLEVYCVAFSPDGKTLATGSADTSVLIWNLK